MIFAALFSATMVKIYFTIRAYHNTAVCLCRFYYHSKKINLGGLSSLFSPPQSWQTPCVSVPTPNKKKARNMFISVDMLSKSPIYAAVTEILTIRWADIVLHCIIDYFQDNFRKSYIAIILIDFLIISVIHLNILLLGYDTRFSLIKWNSQWAKKTILHYLWTKLSPLFFVFVILRKWTAEKE